MQLAEPPCLPAVLTNLAATEEVVSSRRPPRQRTRTISPVIVRDSIRIADALLLTQVAPLLSRRILPLILPQSDIRADTLLCIAAGGIAFFLICALRQYERTALRQSSRFIGFALIAQCAGYVTALYLASLLGSWPDGIMTGVGIWLLCGGVSLAALHALLVPRINAWSNAGRFARAVGVVGVNDTSRRFIEHTRRSSTDSMRLFGVYGEQARGLPSLHAGLVVRGQISDLVREIRCGCIDTVVIALPASSAGLAARICKQLESCAADVHVLPDFPGLHLKDRSPLDIAPLMTVAERPLKDWKAAHKRAFDLIAGSLLFLLLLPLLVLVAVVIRCESPGPILFCQRRTGFNNMDFTIYKFRTMHQAVADPNCNHQTSRGDLRVTGVGKWLRRLSIDELPQLLNVLKGDMSLVGPRPHAPNTRAGNLLLNAAVARYAHRHRVRPGITGWAQVNGCRGAICSTDEILRRVEHDLYYINNWSLLLDLRILGLTIAREVVSGRAY
jgi:Undecaprenyl-phosphate glucose phosphotransferase